MRLATKVAYNTLVQIFSKFLATALGLAAVAIMTRYLGQTGFGEYTTVMTFISFFAIVADLGLTLVTVQLISRPGADEKKILGNLLALRLVTAVFFLGLAPLAVLFFPYPPLIKLGVAIMTVSFLCAALSQVFVGLFQKHLRLDRVSIAEVAGRLALVAAVVLAVWLDRGLTGVIVATALSGFVSLFLHYFFSRRFTCIKLAWDFGYWREIMQKSWPLAITIFFNLIYLKTDTLLLSLLPRPSAIGIIAEVGVYGAAYKVIDILITVPFMFAGIILPVLTARWAENNRAGFKMILQKACDVMVIFALPLVIGTQFIARQTMVFVAGEEFFQSAPVLQILIVAAGVIFPGTMFAHAIIAIDRQKKIINAYIFTAVTAVIGYLVFIPRFSYFGAAWVTIYSEIFIAAASLYLVWKYTGFFPRLTAALKAAAAAGVMALALYGCNIYLTTNLFALLTL
ncbi:MAG: flippase, partial [Planctomycetes bacterium]|nr:flippase [Planctomycetota bacterium]